MATAGARACGRWLPAASLARFIYDGLGRLIEQHTDLTADSPRKTELYYDGVRRIHERYKEGGTVVGPIDPLENFVMLLGGGGGPPVAVTWTETDYVWGPDYVDELTFIINPDVIVRYVLQDANHNVVAYARDGGMVYAQYAYGPYGDLRIADLKDVNSPPRFAVSHQGLFFVRLDGTADDGPLVEDAVGLYYNRNRWYSPDLGRFLQRDVNETALPIITALSFNGQTLAALVGSFDGQSLYADGMNLYAYLGANPVNLNDPLGLTYDDSWLDEFIDDHTGHRLYALGAINEGARWASLGLETALDIAGAVLGIDVLASVAVLASGGGGFWDAMNIVAAANPIGRLGRVGGVLGKAFKWARRGSKSSRIVGTAAEHLFKILPYNQARKLTKGWNNKIQAHHILEVRHAQKWGIKTGDVPAVILTRAEHQRITNALQTRLKTARNWQRHEVWAAYQEVYAKHGYGEWLQHIEKYFR